MVAAPSDAAAALVMPAGRAPEAAPGVSAAIAEMFRSIAPDTDVVSQHAFDAPAFEVAANGPPVLHTLHLPPGRPGRHRGVGRGRPGRPGGARRWADLAREGHRACAAGGPCRGASGSH